VLGGGGACVKKRTDSEKIDVSENRKKTSKCDYISFLSTLLASEVFFEAFSTIWGRF